MGGGRVVGVAGAGFNAWINLGLLASGFWLRKVLVRILVFSGPGANHKHDQGQEDSLAID